KRSLGLNTPGAMANHVSVPVGFVHPVPPQIEPMDAVGLEPLAVAVHAFRLGEAAEGDAVAIIGCGTEGLLLTQVATAMGARVLAADMRADSRSPAVGSTRSRRTASGRWSRRGSAGGGAAVWCRTGAGWLMPPRRRSPAPPVSREGRRWRSRACSAPSRAGAGPRRAGER